MAYIVMALPLASSEQANPEPGIPALALHTPAHVRVSRTDLAASPFHFSIFFFFFASSAVLCGNVSHHRGTMCESY